MDPGDPLPTDPTTFADVIAAYSHRLSTVLKENSWFWNMRNGSAWARRDPEFRKVLARLDGLLQEVRRRTASRPETSIDATSRPDRTQDILTRVLVLVGAFLEVVWSANTTSGPSRRRSPRVGRARRSTWRGGILVP